MAPSNILSFQFLIICSLYLHFRAAISDQQLSDISMLRSCNIDKIYQLGDSLSDTGNHILENPFDQCSKPPYGSSFFENPTGRCSDGLLMIDYIEIRPWYLLTENHMLIVQVSPDTGIRVSEYPTRKYVEGPKYPCFLASGTLAASTESQQKCHTTRQLALVVGDALRPKTSSFMSFWIHLCLLRSTIQSVNDRASAAGIPFLNPYLNATANFSNGANFAVVGSTALSVQVIAKEDILSSVTNYSLDVQLDWLSKHLSLLCKSELDCRPKKLRNALFMVGETGGNDYNYALLQGKTIEEAKSMVPEVVQVIIDAVRRVVNLGAVQVVVPGNIPIGCVPVFLTAFQSNNATAYDNHHCLKDLNDFAIFHNQYLQKAISVLKEESPNTKIVYADYYNAFQWLLENCPYLGFDITSTLKACCGSGGKYSYSSSRVCGSINVRECSHPDQYISWDGMHMTQKAYEFLAKWLVADILPQLNCNINISYY